MLPWFLAGFLCAGIIVFTAAYFKFAALRKSVLRAKLRLDAQRKSRRDLIPSLALSAATIPELGRSFAYALNELKEKCASSDTLAKHIACEEELSKTLSELFSQAAKHEELETDEHFKHLRKSLITAEDRIQSGKKRYNSAVRDFNTLAAIFPLNFISRLLEFEPFEYFDFTKSI